jgi:hypothetical protein
MYDVRESAGSKRPGIEYGRRSTGYEASACVERTGVYWPGGVGGYLSAEDALSFLEDEAASTREYLDELDRHIRQLRRDQGRH